MSVAENETFLPKVFVKYLSNIVKYLSNIVRTWIHYCLQENCVSLGDWPGWEGGRTLSLSSKLYAIFLTNGREAQILASRHHTSVQRYGGFVSCVYRLDTYWFLFYHYHVSLCFFLLFFLYFCVNFSSLFFSLRAHFAISEPALPVSPRQRQLPAWRHVHSKWRVVARDASHESSRRSKITPTYWLKLKK